MPGRIVDYGGFLAVERGIVAHHVHSLVGDLAVDALALVVVLVDFVADLAGVFVIAADEQVDGGPSGLHTAGGVDARSDLEDDLVDGDHVLVEPRELDYGLETLAGVGVEPLEAVVCKYAVLSGD